ncbi:MAG: hypothetical protein QMC80_05075 [Thermoplasmatales archaeon]|nr:hypothetical protein [Thermoplasmatales archaeon]
MEIDFDEKEKSIDVSPGANCSAVFNGMLDIESDSRMNVYINVKVEGPEETIGWDVAVSPSYIEGAMAGVQNIPITVYVHTPPEIKAVSGNVIVSARGNVWGWAGQPVTAETQLLVKIKPYYRFSICSSVPYQDVPVYSTVGFNIRIKNEGNDVINDLVIDIDAPDGWLPLKPSSSLTIENKGNITATVKIVTPKEWTLWKDNIQKIKITVSSNKIGVSEDFDVYVHQKGTYIPGFEPMITIIILSMIAIMLRRMRKWK